MYLLCKQMYPWTFHTETKGIVDNHMVSLGYQTRPGATANLDQNQNTGATPK